MVIKELRAIIKSHPFLTAIFVAVGLYFLHAVWYNGYFAITRTQKLRAQARRSIYYQSYKPGMPNPLPFPSWSRDKKIIQQAKASGDELVPYLAEEISLSDNPYSLNDFRINAARFILAHVIRSKKALAALATQGGSHEIAKLMGPAALTCSIPSGSKVEFPKLKLHDFWTNSILQWYTKYNSRIVDTDYGIGITMPDGTIRPLGYHGIINPRSTLSSIYFCTERIFVYSQKYTSVKDELGSIIAENRSLAGEKRLERPEIQKEARNEFLRLFDERVANDDTFWPYYPIFHHIYGTDYKFFFVIGYYDSQHRQHGPWRDVDESNIVQDERWFFHGEEVTEEEYYERGGYDMDISLCTACPGIPAIESAPEQASGQ